MHVNGRHPAPELTQPHAAAPTVIHVATAAMSVRYLLLDQLLYLQRKGYNVLAISAPGSDIAPVEQAGIRHIALPLTRHLSPLTDLRAVAQLRQVMRQENATIVHAHTPKPGLLAQLAARVAGVPIVVNTIHGYYFTHRASRAQYLFYLWLERVAARFSDRIWFQSREDIDTARQLRIAPMARVAYLGNGINIEQFDARRVSAAQVAATAAALNLPAGKQIVGYVGRLVAEKGLHELMQAARNLTDRRDDVHFLIVGEPDTDKADVVTAAIAAQYGVAAHCTFAGLRHDIPTFYRMMDMLVLPSYREGMPRAPMEASAMGVPSIVSDVRGCREVVVDGENGLLVPVRDGQALTAAIDRLLNEPALRHSMGEVGRRMGRTRFDQRAVFARIEQGYAELLADRQLPGPPAPAGEQKQDDREKLFR